MKLQKCTQHKGTAEFTEPMGSSKSKVNRITSRDKAILEVKVQRDRLKQYQKKLKFVTERETEIAKEHLKNGNKPLALLALKKRNYQNGLLQKTEDQLFTLEQLVQSIEFAQVEAQVFAGLKTGNQILKEIQNEIKIEDVEKLMEDTAEAIAYQNEVSQLLAGSELVSIDEDDLLEELEALKSKETVKAAKDDHVVVKDDGVIEIDGEKIELPSVPKDSIKVQEPEQEHLESYDKEKELIAE